MSNEHSDLPRVVQVIDDYELVINKGTVDGIQNGDRFLIFAIGEEIFDPQTQESLGFLETVRGRTTVVHTQAKMSTLRSITEVEVGSGRRIYRKPNTSLSAFAALAGGFRDEEIIEDPQKQLADLEASVGDFAKPI